MIRNFRNFFRNQARHEETIESKKVLKKDTK